MLKDMQESNQHVAIRPVTDASFAQFGRIISQIDFSNAIQELGTKEIPESGNRYVADDSAMHIEPFASEIRTRLFGDMDIEIGYCNGHTHCLNALEYHKSSEVNFCATDCILMLAVLFDLHDDRIDADAVSLYYLPAGTAVELYATTLHFAPCAVDASGFRVGVILPAHTNEALAEGRRQDEPLLFGRNKWLIAHPDSPSASRGAFCGITGENITLNV